MVSLSFGALALAPAAPASAATVAPTIAIDCGGVVAAVPGEIVPCTYEVLQAPGKPVPVGAILLDFYDPEGLSSTPGGLFMNHNYAGGVGNFGIQAQPGRWTFDVQYQPDPSVQSSYRRAYSATLAITGDARNDFPPFVESVYVDLLDRAADQGGETYWVNRLRRGDPRTSMAMSFLLTPEALQNQVNDTYLRILGRDAEPSARQAWAAQLAAGLTLEQLEAILVGSDEFWAAAGSTTDGFIDLMYAVQLGRDPDQYGSDYFHGRLGQNPTETQRRDAGAASSYSTERLSNVVDGFYLHLLDRHGDPTGVAYWVGRIQHGTRDEVVIALVTASDEYVDNALAAA